MRPARLALGLTLVVTAALLLIPREETSGVPFRPAANEVLEHVDGTFAADAELDADEAAALAQRLLLDARRRGGDTRLIGRAQASLSPWWNDAAAPARVRFARALVKLELDDLDGAQLDLSGLDEPEAIRHRASVFRLMGRLDEALELCRKLEGIEVRACLTSVESLRGQAGPAAEVLERELARSARAPAWAFAVAADAFAISNRHSNAIAAYEQSLRRDEADCEVRAALARSLVLAGRASELPALFSARELSDWELITFVQSGQASEADRAALAERMTALERRADQSQLRDRAAYFAWIEREPGKALPLALANFARHQTPIDVRLLLEAAKAANDEAAAAPARAWLQRTGFEGLR